MPSEGEAWLRVFAYRRSLFYRCILNSGVMNAGLILLLDADKKRA
jgi:hypothetical protein